MKNVSTLLMVTLASMFLQAESSPLIQRQAGSSADQNGSSTTTSSSALSSGEYSIFSEKLSSATPLPFQLPLLADPPFLDHISTTFDPWQFLGSVEALTTEVHSPGASFAGPPTSRPFTLPDYPGYGQYTAYYSAVSAAASLGNVTAPFAQPTGFTTYNLNSGVPNAQTILRTGEVCPTGMGESAQPKHSFTSQFCSDNFNASLFLWVF